MSRSDSGASVGDDRACRSTARHARSGPWLRECSPTGVATRASRSARHDLAGPPRAAHPVLHRDGAWTTSAHGPARRSSSAGASTTPWPTSPMPSGCTSSLASPDATTGGGGSCLPSCSPPSRAGVRPRRGRGRRRWDLLPAGLGLSVALLGAGYAVSSVMSIGLRTRPEAGESPFSAPPGRAGITIAAQSMASLGTVVLAGPDDLLAWLAWQGSAGPLGRRRRRTRCRRGRRRHRRRCAAPVSTPAGPRAAVGAAAQLGNWLEDLVTLRAIHRQLTLTVCSRSAPGSHSFVLPEARDDHPVARRLKTSSRGPVVQWGWVTITVANLVVILLMILVFVLALLLPFPEPREDEHR